MSTTNNKISGSWHKSTLQLILNRAVKNLQHAVQRTKQIWSFALVRTTATRRKGDI